MEYEYVITITYSCNRNGILVLGCDWGSNYRARNGINDATRIWNISTQLQSCSFEIQGKSKNGNWLLSIKEVSHNHEASVIPSAYFIQCQITSEIKTQVRELMAAEIPILLGVDGEAKKIFVDEGQAALFFEPDDYNALANQIIELFQSRELRAELGKNFLSQLQHGLKGC